MNNLLCHHIYIFMFRRICKNARIWYLYCAFLSMHWTFWSQISVIISRIVSHFQNCRNIIYIYMEKRVFVIFDFLKCLLCWYCCFHEVESSQQNQHCRSKIAQIFRCIFLSAKMNLHLLLFFFSIYKFNQCHDLWKALWILLILFFV